MQKKLFSITIILFSLFVLLPVTARAAEEKPAHTISVKPMDGITWIRTDAPEETAVEGTLVTFQLVEQDPRILQFLDPVVKAGSKKISFEWNEATLSFYMPDSDVSISCNNVSLMYADGSIKLLPQTINKVPCFFLPSNADYAALNLYGTNISISRPDDPDSPIIPLSTDVHSPVDLTLLFGEDMKAGVSYSVSVTEKSKTYTVKVMKADHISSLYIASDKSLSQLMESKEEEGSGTLVLVRPDGSVVNSGDNGNTVLKKIKGRGNTSWQYAGTKKSFNITLNKSSELISGAGKAKKWCLITDAVRGYWVHEGSALANTVAYDMYEAIGGKWSLQHEFINLYINSKYQGVYLLTEKVEINDTRVDIKETDYAVEDKTNVTRVEVTKQSDAELFDAGILAYQYATDSTLAEGTATGGLLLERDFRADGEASWFTTRRDISYSIKEPEYATKEQVRQAALYIQRFEDAVYSDTGYNDQGEYYADLIDMDSHVKRAIIEMIASNQDAFYSSCFYTIDVDAQGNFGKIYAGPAWDFDGSNYAHYNRSGNPSDTIRVHHLSVPFFRTLLKHGDFAAAFAKLSNGTMKEVWDAEKEKVASYISSLNSSYQMNAAAKIYNTGTAGNLAKLQTDFNDRYNLWYNNLFDDSKLLGLTAAYSRSGTLIYTITGTASKIEWKKLNENGKLIDVEFSSDNTPTETGTYYAVATGNAYNAASSSSDIGKVKIFSNPVVIEKLGSPILARIEIEMIKMNKKHINEYKLFSEE